MDGLSAGGEALITLARFLTKPRSFPVLMAKISLRLPLGRGAAELLVVPKQKAVNHTQIATFILVGGCGLHRTKV